jgi:hypothetical protein
MTTYESQLEAISKAASVLRVNVNSARSNTAGTSKSELLLKPLEDGITGAELAKRVNVSYDPTQFEETVKQGSRRLREWNHFPDMVSKMNKWVTKADEMETEGGQ